MLMASFPFRLMMIGGICLGAVCNQAQPFSLNFPEPTLDRWMYPFNQTPESRATAPVFGTLGDADGVDTRHGQYLLGFDTFSQVATNLGPRNYLIRRARLTATINRDLTFRYDPTPDDYRTYFETNHPEYRPDTDPGKPIELFGADFRNGYTAATFEQTTDFNTNTLEWAAPGGRTAFAAGYDTNGALVDVSNNVGKTNVAFPPFEVYPFAIGQTTAVPAGDYVPTGSLFTFDLNLADPLVAQYLQTALDTGRLRFMLSSLSESEYMDDTGTFVPSWPDFFTRFSVLGDPPTLELEGTVISATDTDHDGLPDDWENFYFTNLTQTAEADFDHDGASNYAEYLAGTDPTDAASVLRVTSLAREEADTVLRFNFAASRQYEIESSSDLQTWSALTNPGLRYYSAPGEVEWRDDRALTNSLPRFYRVKTH